MSDVRMLKYPLFDTQQAAFDDTVKVSMQYPCGGPMYVAMQNGVVTLWAMSDAEFDPYELTFFIVGTGHLLDGEASYCGTAFDRQFVWHIFQAAPRASR
jgi:hypothetical protein